MYLNPPLTPRQKREMYLEYKFLMNKTPMFETIVEINPMKQVLFLPMMLLMKMKKQPIVAPIK